MKNQYVGDLNDYYKLSLLRIVEEVGLKVFIVWMLTPNDDESKDGRRVKYLENRNAKKWRKYDSRIYGELEKVKDIILGKKGERSVRWLENNILNGILSARDFYSEYVPDGQEKREEWFRKLLEKLDSKVNLVFLDPDNGLEVKSVPYGKKKSSKYVYFKELQEFWDRGKSLLIYQHYPRGKRKDFERRLVERIRDNFGNVEILLFRTSYVAFVLVLNKCHEGYQNEIIKSVKKIWKNKITIVTDDKLNNSSLE